MAKQREGSHAVTNWGGTPTPREDVMDATQRARLEVAGVPPELIASGIYKDTAALFVPVAPVPTMDLQGRANGCHVSGHLNLHCKTPDQRIALWRLVRGLQAKVARTQDGRIVATAADAVRWLLEQLI